MRDNDEADDEIIREVYAHFGLAMYMAGVLESGMANALMLLEWRPRLKLPISQADYLEQYEAQFTAYRKLSMGQLLARIKALSEFPEEMVDELQRCLKARNILTHHYFWERAGDFMLESGQLRMIAECDEYRDLFHRVDRLLDKITRARFEAIGVNESVVQQMKDELISEARKRHEETPNDSGPRNVESL